MKEALLCCIIRPWQFPFDLVSVVQVFLFAFLKSLISQKDCKKYCFYGKGFRWFLVQCSVFDSRFIVMTIFYLTNKLPTASSSSACCWFDFTCF